MIRRYVLSMYATAHALIASLAGDVSQSAVVDLGSGREGTLVDLTLGFAVAVDADHQALAGRSDPARRLVADLAHGLPFKNSAFDVVISHNTLECLSDPQAFVRECGRILRPKGTLLLGHTEFDSIAVNATDRERCRQVLRTYCELPVLYRFMQHADSQMGRQLPGLLRTCGFTVAKVVPHVQVELRLAGSAAARITEIAWSVRSAISAGTSRVTEAEVSAWLEDLGDLDDSGNFFFSETAYVALAYSDG